MASIIGAMGNGVDPDVAVRRLSLRLEGDGTVIPEAYLEPPRSSERLMRGEAARLLDTAVRACVDAQGLGTRLAVITAHRMRSERAHERLGYRTDADYAREELGISPREFRDMARLGGRLEVLPAIRWAFVDQRLSRTQAEVVTRIATASDEEEWLALAEAETVRGLKAAVRAARERCLDEQHSGERPAGEQPASPRQTGEHRSGGRQAREQRAGERQAGESQTGEQRVGERRVGERRAGERRADGHVDEPHADDPRRRCTFDVPVELLGKIDAVLELAARVAGGDLPPGALWELIAADYLSGASPLPDGGEPDDGEGDGAAGARRAGAHPGEGARPGSRTGEDARPGSRSGEDAGASSRTGEDTGAGAANVAGASCGGGEDAVASARRNDDDRPSSARAQHPPEDPHGYQRWCEQESRRWPWLPRAKARLELHGDWKELRRRCLTDEPRTPWELHDDMQAALAVERRVAWQIGRLLTLIRNRRLWRILMFASFAHYVTERLGISVRVAERLVRVDREAWSYRPLLRAWQAGELSPLVADALVRVLPHVEHDPSIQQAWIDYALHTTFERLRAVIRAAERMRAEMLAGNKRRLRFPEEVERAMATGGGPPMFVTGGGPSPDAAAGGEPPMFVTGERLPLDADAGGEPPMFVTGEGPSPDAAAGGKPPMFVTGERELLDSGAAGDNPPMFVDGPAGAGELETGAAAPGTTLSVASNARSSLGNARYVVWITDGELEVLQRAIAHVRSARARGDGGPPLADSACLDILLDEFVRTYADVAADMRARYPLFERDGWRCTVPGCSAHGPLHLHHIVFRAHGGGDEPENVTALCAMHHKALHDGWIRCVGRAPNALYWELGTDRGVQFGAAPVARIAGHRRLTANEYWDGVRVRRMEDGAGAA